MNEVVKEWITALRSGNYKQGRSFLRKDDAFCCLGVLCDLAVKKGIIPSPKINTFRRRIVNDIDLTSSYYSYDDSNVSITSSQVLSPTVRTWADLNSDFESTLMTKNDTGSDFNKIADFIEEVIK